MAELSLYSCGGRGLHLRRTPLELTVIGHRSVFRWEAGL